MSAAPSSLSEQVIEIRTLEAVRVAQVQIRRFAASLGFDHTAQWEITIAASEAGTNMVKYGGGGLLTLSRLSEPQAGLRFEARDSGPGIANIELAWEDHVSEGADVRVQTERRGLGVGLGAISRLMDANGWQNLEDGGLLWAEKYLR